MRRRKSFEDLVYNIPYRKIESGLGDKLDKKTWVFVNPGCAYDLWDEITGGVDGPTDNGLDLINMRVHDALYEAVDILCAIKL